MCWGLFPKNSLTPCGEKKFLLGGHDLAIRGVSKYKVDMIFIIFRELESARIYEIHHFQLKFVSAYRKEVKIITITYFLATLPILATKIAITRYQ